MFQNNKEIEVRFLDINIEKLLHKLHSLNAQDHGDKLLDEIIFYDEASTWSQKGQFVRLRKDGNKVVMCFKQHRETNDPVKKTSEIEIVINDFTKGELFLKSIGLVAYRRQQKRRHSFSLNEVIIDIDEWPKLPPYVEIEGSSLESIKETASKLDLDWNNVVYDDAKVVIETIYKIPVSKLKYFTFDKVE